MSRPVPNVVDELVGYQYVVLRCVPRIEREEFLNVGVVLFAQAADFLESAHRVDRERLHALAADVDLAAVEDALSTVQAVCRGDDGRGLPQLPSLGKRFGWLSAPRSTIVQPGPRHGGVCRSGASPQDELARLLEVLVT